MFSCGTSEKSCRQMRTKNCLLSATESTQYFSLPCQHLSHPCNSVFLGMQTAPIQQETQNTRMSALSVRAFSGLSTAPTTSTCWTTQPPGLPAPSDRRLPTTPQPTTDFDKAEDWFQPSGSHFSGNAQTEPMFNSSWSQFQGCPYIEPQGLYGGGTGVRVSSLSPGGLGSVPRTLNTETHFPYYVKASQQAVKKAYLRAVDKLRLTGRTVYKGRQMFANPNLSRIFPRKVQDHRKRIRYASWNAGGLSADVMAEALVWAARQELDCLLLQETHWSQTREWQQDGWLCIHTAAAKPKQGGVLVCLRATKAPVNLVRWNELVAGRAVHVRAEIKGQQLDILAIYQVVRAVGSVEALDGNLKRRKQVWQALDRCLSSLPRRSLILLAGDFNTAFVRTPGVIGGGVLPCNAHAKYKEEADSALRMLMRHQLQACSTFGKKRPTYVHPMSQSHIDYVFIRRQASDVQAKQAGPVATPIAEWRTGGHKVLQGSILAEWKPWRHSVRTASVIGPADEGRSDPCTNSIRDLRSTMLHLQGPAEKRTVAPELADMTNTVVSFWTARSAFLGQRVESLRECFDKLRRFSHMQKPHRALRTRARRRKRDEALHVLHALHEAETAANRGDSKGLYACIRFLAGGRKGGKLRLRDADGQLVGHGAECDLLATYAAELFSGNSERVQFRHPLPSHWFSAEEWRWAIGQLRSGRAVPSGQPLVQVWKAHTDTVAQRLSQISVASLCSSSPFVPLQWCDVELAWLPKPRKSPVTPKSLRSVGLTAADTKSFLVLLKKHSTAPILESLWSTPQFAYRPHVDTYNAILRAISHCLSVREMQQHRRTDHTSRLLAGHSEGFTGGLMISLDLAKAFDSVPHSELYAALIESGVQQALVECLLSVHQHTRCDIRQSGQVRSVDMGRGLRQGCPIAPILFSAWTARLCRRLDSLLGAGWSQRHLGIFADDTWGSWQVRQVEHMRRAFRDIEVLLGVMQSLGVSINFEKSSLVISMQGPGKNSITRDKLVQWKGKLQARFAGPNGSVYIPVVDSFVYLGICLSYGSFELETIRHRVEKATSNFNQLRRVLRTNSTFTKANRLRVYTACVWSSLRYGVCAVGITPHSYSVLISTLCSQLRKVMRVFQHGVSNQEVLTMASLNPMQAFRDQLSAIRARLQRDTGRSQEFVQAEMDAVTQRIQVLEAVHSTQRDWGLIEIASSPGSEHHLRGLWCGLWYRRRPGHAY